MPSRCRSAIGKIHSQRHSVVNFHRVTAIRDYAQSSGKFLCDIIPIRIFMYLILLGKIFGRIGRASVKANTAITARNFLCFILFILSHAFRFFPVYFFLLLRMPSFPAFFAAEDCAPVPRFRHGNERAALLASEGVGPRFRLCLFLVFPVEFLTVRGTKF